MINKRWFFILALSFITAVSAVAQTRTVTNSDLEKFRQERLAAEKDLRDNYEKLGFPSPEELEKQIERSRVERAELSARLQADNLERERINLERQIAENEARNNYYQSQPRNYSQYENDYFSGYAPYGFLSFQNSGFPNRRFNRFNRGGSGGNFGNQPRIEYRNNLPVIVQPPPRRILAPRQANGGRRN